MRGENVGFLLLVVAFTLPPLIRPGFAGPPSPEGEGFGAGEPGNCLRKRTGSVGACPRPTNGAFPLFKLLSHIEPGDPLRCGSTARVVGSHCQRPLAALASPSGRGGTAQAVTERAFYLVQSLGKRLPPGGKKAGKNL